MRRVFASLNSLRSLAFMLLVVGSSHAARAQVDCAVQTNISQSECEALVTIYNSTGGPNWRHQDRWLQDNFPCAWQRVGCNGRNRIEELDLGNNNLVGTIPTEIGNFPFLRMLDIGADPGLTGPIPTELGNLTRLEVLILGGSPIIPTFPASMSNLTSLKEVDLFGATFDLANLGWLGNQQSLEVVRMADVGLTGHWPASWNNWPNLRLLDVSHNAFTGALPALAGYPLAYEIDLGGNDFVDWLPADLGTLTNLQRLLLGGNSLIGPLPAGLSNMTSLDWLRLEGNNLSGDIPADFVNLPELSSLAIQGNCLFASDPAVDSYVSSLEGGGWEALQCQSLFTDGFESGDLSAWSAVAP